MAVLEDMDIVVVSQNASAFDGEVKARTAKDERVEVEVDSPSTGRSDVKVRVGLLDKSAAQRIMDRILAKISEAKASG